MWWGGGIYAKPVPVDDHVVMKPTEGGEIRRVVRPALGFWGDVVGLEPVAGLAAVGGAGASVAVEDEPSQFGWDRS